VFDYNPEEGPARCPHQDCGWSFGQQAGTVEAEPEVTEVFEPESENLALSTVESNTPAEQYTHRNLARPEHHSPLTGTVRCPSCSTRVPESAVVCPVCAVDLDRELGRQEGVRAVFDVSGDIIFTPKMVAFLFVVTLGAFLAFTWIISGKNSGDDYVPLTLNAGNMTEQPGGEHVKGLQGVEFARIKREFLDARATDLRLDVLRDQFNGERVIWNGMVTGVERDGQAYRVEVVMGDPDSHGYVTLRALNHGANVSRIANLRRGDQVMFSGSIDQMHTGGAYDPLDFFRIELVNVLLLN